MAKDQDQEDEEHAPFLPPTKDPSPEGVENPKTKTNPKPTLTALLPHPLSLLSHTLLLTLYTLLLLHLRLLHKAPPPDPNTPRPPIPLTITYAPTTFHNLSQSPYAGAPSAEMDARWEELIAPTLVRVEGEVLRRVGVGSVALDGGDYLAWLGVGHGVHCLNMIRQWRHRDHYHSAALSEKEKDKMGQHVDHCIEHLRQTTLCHADTSATSLATFRWTRQDKRPMFDADDGMVHECVDWDVLVRSLVEGGRVVREGEVRGLRNPLFDYGGGEGEGGA